MPAHISSKIPDNLRRELPERLSSAHRLDGWAAPGPDMPFLFFRTHKTKLDQVSFFAEGISGVFGGTLVVGARVRQDAARVCVYPGTPEFNQLQEGRFVAVFVRGRSQIVGSREVKLDRVNRIPTRANGMSISSGPRTLLFSKCWSVASQGVPVLMDQRARHWECLGVMQDFYDSFRPEELLSIGWAINFHMLVRSIKDAIEEFDKSEPLTLSDPEVQAHLRVLLDVINRPDLSVQLLVDAFSLFHDQSEESHWTFEKYKIRLGDTAASTREFDLVSLLSWANQAYYVSSEMTNDGRRVVLIDSFRSNKLSFLNLEPTEFPHAFSPQLYWRRLPVSILEGFDGCLTGGDVPLDLGGESPLWKTFPLAEDAERSFDAATLLIDEARAMKKWAIPNGAIVKLKVGPFEYFELWEFSDGVYFLGRSEKEEFSGFWLNMKYCFLEFLDLEPEFLSILEVDEARKLRAALMLLFSAIVRDFHVVETREKVFATRLQRLNIQRLQREGPVTVYLPRVRYVSSADVQQCATELSHQERRPHLVRGHLRKSTTASEYQVLIASRYGFEVPTGYTFVRPHERGKKSRDTIYRSRSALQSLYQAINPETGRSEKPAEWFQFERDVQTVMKKLGFETEHVAASHRGDHGVDVYATKGRDLDAISWVIQCKCYSPNRKVQPSTVRELLGALEECPRGTRGMIVTTSTFTSGARRRAEETNIHLIEGEEFTRLLGSETTG